MSISSVTSYLDGDPLTPAHLNSKLNPLVDAIVEMGAGGSTLSLTTNFIPVASSNTGLTNSVMSINAGVLSGMSVVAIGTNPAASGVVRLPFDTQITSNNSVGTATIVIAHVTGSDGVNIGNSATQFRAQGSTVILRTDGADQVVVDDGLIRPVATNDIDLGTSSLYFKDAYLGRTLLSASSTSATLRVPHGSTPSSLTDGDIWTTTSGIFVRVNGATVGPLGTGGSGTTLGGSGTTTRLAYWSGGTTLGDIEIIRDASASPNIVFHPQDNNNHDWGSSSSAWRSVYARALRWQSVGSPLIFDATMSFGTTETHFEWARGASAVMRLTGDGVLDVFSRVTTPVVHTQAGTTSAAPLRIPHGSAPSSPTNGDIWTTTAGIYVRINGSTVGPLGTGGSGSGVTGSGTIGRVARWSNTDQLEDAAIQDSASFTTFINPSLFSSALTVNGALAVAGAAAFNGNVTLGDATSDTVTITGRIGATIEAASSSYGLGTSSQPFNNVYLSGSGAGVYVSGDRVVAGRDTGWALTLTGLANGKDNDISSTQLSNAAASLDDAATLGNLIAVAEVVASLYSAMAGHGLLGA